MFMRSLVFCLAAGLLFGVPLPCPAQTDFIGLTGGAGGNGTMYAAGGQGGDATMTIPGDVDVLGGTGPVGITMNSGNGGNSGIGPNARGGRGGDTTLSVGGTLTNADVFTVTAGNGGNSDYSVPAGDGGTATFRTAQAILGDALTITSGANGGGNTPAFAGKGGAANFTANTLSAPAINLIKNGGALTFSVGTLNVTTGNTTLALDGTTAAGVDIGRVALSGGHTFAVNSANSGTGAFGLLDVTGTGGTLAAPAAQLFANVNLAGGSILTSANGLNFSTMRVLGPGAGYDGAFSAVGRHVLFALDGVPSGSTMLTVNNGLMDISGAALRFLDVPGGRPFPSAGYALTLVDGKTGAPARDIMEARQGLTLRHTFALDAAGNTLTAVYRSTDAHPQTKALSEGKLAGHAFVNQGSDLIIGPAMQNILARPKPGGGLVPFAASMGGSSRYDTGSHADVGGLSGLAGLGWRQPMDGNGSQLLAGAFLEAGRGGYDSYNAFSNWASVKGDGNTNYCGGGLLGRFAFPLANAAPDVRSGVIYADASFRAGQARTDFASGDLVNDWGQNGDYDSTSTYYGAHAGLGYVWNVTEKASLDVSTRYIWTHQDGDSVHVAGDPVRFKAIDSQRWRTGARFAYALNESIAPYAGAYYDHEFDGRARATTYGFAIDAPSLQGGTGVGELGLTITSAQDSGLSMDFGVQGYIGVREGVSGSLQLKFAF